LREKPSIAVLPLRYLGLDTPQDFVADGLTEDIINALSKFRERTVRFLIRGGRHGFRGKRLRK
jgi:TolB-like protein